MIKPEEGIKYKSLPGYKQSDFGDQGAKVAWLEFMLSSPELLTDELATNVVNAISEHKNLATKFNYKTIHENAHNPHIYKMLVDNIFRENIFREAFSSENSEILMENTIDMESPALNCI